MISLTYTSIRVLDCQECTCSLLTLGCKLNTFIVSNQMHLSIKTMRTLALIYIPRLFNIDQTPYRIDGQSAQLGHKNQTSISFSRTLVDVLSNVCTPLSKWFILNLLHRTSPFTVEFTLLFGILSHSLKF